MAKAFNYTFSSSLSDIYEKIQSSNNLIKIDTRQDHIMKILQKI